MDIIIAISDFLWGNIIAYVLLGVGLYFTIRLGVPQIRYFFSGWKGILKKEDKEEGKISGFGAVMAAVGGQVGTGSLVGVASAIFAGGPGAVFWMWVTAIFGMAITFGEAVLGQIFNERLEDGTMAGGPAYYIHKGLNSKFFAVVISLLYAGGVGLFIASLQANSIAAGIIPLADVNPLWIGVALVIISGIIIVGGATRITELASKLVPVMAIGYILAVLYIIITNLELLPIVLKSIFSGAFSYQAAAGGVVGYGIKEAFRHGVARGLFSNDAGNGVAAILHATADVDHPVEQGFLGMIGTFITTIIICSMTAFAILMTGVLTSGLNGVNLVQAAFSEGMGVAGPWVVMIAIVLFSFTTLIADIFYGENSLTYIFKNKAGIPIWIYRVILAILLVVSTVTELSVLWGLIDFSVGLIVFINVVAMMMLFKYVKYALDDYMEQKKQGIEKPKWDKNADEIMAELNHKSSTLKN